MWFFKSPSGLQIDLAAGIASGDGQDSLISVEDVVGSRHADEISGTDGPNAISSSTDDDTVYGLAGDDQPCDWAAIAPSRHISSSCPPVGQKRDRGFGRSGHGDVKNQTERR